MSNYPERTFVRPRMTYRYSKYIFSGFAKGCYDRVKFDSDSERKLAVIFERDAAVHRWIKVSEKQLTISYKIGHGTRDYNPDFIVETSDGFVIVEVKAQNQLDSEE